ARVLIVQTRRSFVEERTPQGAVATWWTWKQSLTERQVATAPRTVPNHFLVGCGEGAGSFCRPIIRARTSGGICCKAFCISSLVSGRLIDSGACTGTPGRACACLKIGFGVGVGAL